MLLLRQLFEHMDSRGFDTKDARAACRLTSTSVEAEIERAQETVPATATASTIGETTPDQNSTAQEHSGHAHADVTIDTDAIMDTGEHATNPQPSMENVAETSNVAVPIAASVAKKKMSQSQPQQTLQLPVHKSSKQAIGDFWRQHFRRNRKNRNMTQKGHQDQEHQHQVKS
jgi:hypothetical protein